MIVEMCPLYIPSVLFHFQYTIGVSCFSFVSVEDSSNLRQNLGVKLVH